VTVEALLTEMRRRRVHVELAGTRLRYMTVSRVPDPQLLAALRQRKLEILRYFVDRERADCVGAMGRLPEHWSEDAREEYEERAAIMEFEGGLSRQEAETLAEACVRKRRGQGDGRG